MIQWIKSYQGRIKRPVAAVMIVVSSTLAIMPLRLKGDEVPFSMLLSLLLAAAVLFLLGKIARYRSRQPVGASSDKLDELRLRLERRNRDLERILETIPSGLVVLTRDLRIKAANNSFAEQFSFQMQGMVGQNILTLLRSISDEPDERCALNKALKEFQATRKPLINQIARTLCLGEGLRSIRFSLIECGENQEALLILDDITAFVREERLRQFAVSVSAGIHRTSDLNELYRIVHNELKRLLPADNCYIAIWDREKDVISFPYFVDQLDRSAKDRQTGNGITEYIIRKGEPMYLNEEAINSLIQEGAVTPFGSTPKSFLGSPLKGKSGIFGIIAIQDYFNAKAYRPTDKDILYVAANEVAFAISEKRTDAFIARAKAEWERTVDRIPDLIAVMDDQQRVIRVNQAMADKLGITPREAVGLSCRQAAKGMETPFPFCDHIRQIAEGEEDSMELDEPRWNGTFLVASVPLYDQAEKTLGSIYIARDITEVKHTREILRQAEGHFKTLFERSQELLLIVHPHSGEIVQCNPMIEPLLGYTPQEVIGRNFSLLVPGQAEINGEKGLEIPTGLSGPRPFIGKDGSIVDMTLNAALIPWGPTGAILALLHPVTEAREAVPAALQELQIAHDIVQSIPSGLFIYEYQPPDKLILLDGNPEAERITHINLEEGRGTDFRQLWPQEAGREALAKTLVHVAQTGRTFISDGVLFPHSAGERYYTLRAFSIPGHRLGVALEDMSAWKKSEEKYRLLAENVTDVIWTADLELKLTYISPSIRQLTGFSAEEFMNRPPDKQMTAESLTNLRGHIAQAQARRQGEPTDAHPPRMLELEVYRRDGSTVATEVQLSFLCDPDGEVVGVIGSSRDISQRKQTEAKMLRLASFPTLNPNSIVEVSTDGRLTYHNPTADREFPDLKKRGIRHSLLTGITETIPILKSDPQRHLIQLVNVGYRIYERHISYVPEGDVIRIYALDVTEREEAEEKVRLSEKFNRDLITEAPAGIAYLEKDGTISFVNPIFADLMADSSDQAAQIIGRSLQELFDNQQPDLHPQLLRVLSGETIRLADIELGRSGRLRSFNLHGAPRYGVGGQVIGAVLMMVDMTEYKKLQEQLRHASKMEAVGTLADGIAHDFNNLLTVILGNAQLALMKVKQESGEHLSLEAIKRSADRAAELTTQLLAFGRRRMEKPKPIRLNNLVEEVVMLLKRTLDPRIELTAELDADLWVVMADAGQMHQVLMNLTVNSRAALPQGGRITISSENKLVSADYCRTRSYARQGEYVLLKVVDNGTGIPPQAVPHIFEPFFTTKKGGEGTGLGLAMVYSIVKAHKGWIEVQSEVDRGTTFEIYLPRIDRPPSVELSAAPTFPGGVERILLVDDQQLVLDVGRKILESVGYSVLTAEDGDAALELFRRDKDKIDLVLLDLTMPKRSGLETLQEMMHIAPNAKVIVSSGTDSSEPIEELYKTGAKLFVSKPYRMSELLEAVRKVLDEK